MTGLAPERHDAPESSQTAMQVASPWRNAACHPAAASPRRLGNRDVLAAEHICTDRRRVPHTLSQAGLSRNDSAAVRVNLRLTPHRPRSDVRGSPKDCD